MVFLNSSPKLENVMLEWVRQLWLWMGVLKFEVEWEQHGRGIWQNKVMNWPWKVLQTKLYNLNIKEEKYIVFGNQNTTKHPPTHTHSWRPAKRIELPEEEELVLLIVSRVV